MPHDKPPTPDEDPLNELIETIRLDDAATSLIARGAVARLTKIRAEAAGPPRPGETEEEQVLRLEADIRATSEMLRQFGISTPNIDI